MLAMTAYPMIAMGRVKSITTPRRWRRSEMNATTTRHMSIVECYLGLTIMLTCEHSCDSIWNDRPKLHFVGIFGKVQVFDDCR